MADLGETFGQETPLLAQEQMDLITKKSSSASAVKIYIDLTAYHVSA